MTMTLQKPAPDQVYGERKTIDLGVGDKSYRFVLQDIYVDDPEGKILGADVIRATQNFKPNIMVQGLNNDQIAKIKPGETITFQGVYAPLTRTFEIADIRPGRGPVAAPKNY